LIYIDTCALFKLVQPEKESPALRAWRESLSGDTELITSIVSELELTRGLLRGSMDPTRVPYYRDKALDGVWRQLLRPHHLKRAADYEIRKLGSLDAIHLATAEPHGDELSAFVTYDQELADAASELDMPVLAPA
jgi:predicted nucleic acid-binding protein